MGDGHGEGMDKGAQGKGRRGGVVTDDVFV